MPRTTQSPRQLHACIHNHNTVRIKAASHKADWSVAVKTIAHGAGHGEQRHERANHDREQKSRQGAHIGSFRPVHRPKQWLTHPQVWSERWHQLSRLDCIGWGILLRREVLQQQSLQSLQRSPRRTATATLVRGQANSVWNHGAQWWRQSVIQVTSSVRVKGQCKGSMFDSFRGKR